MDPFSKAGNFYSDALAAQNVAASAQKSNQPRGPVHTMQNREFNSAPDFIEDMKNDMLIKAAAVRREKEDVQKIRAGDGFPTKSVS